MKVNPLAHLVKQAGISHNADPIRQSGLLIVTREKFTVKYKESARLPGTTLEAILKEHNEPRHGEHVTTAQEC